MNHLPISVISVLLQQHIVLKQVFHIKSDHIVRVAEPVLLMEVGDKHVCFGIINRENRQLSEAGYYIAEQEETSLTEYLYGRHAELQGPFYQTLISYHFPDCIFVPLKYFDPGEAISLLNSLVGKNANELTLSEPVAEWDMQNIYRVTKSLHQSLGKNFATGKFWHTYTVALKNSLSVPEGTRLWADFKPNEFTVLLFRDHIFQLAQIFPYSTPADVLYHLLKICSNFSLQQNEIKIILSGLIEQQSALYEELYKYFLHIEFNRPNGAIRMDESFYDYPVHYFSSIYKLAACVS